MRVFQSYHFEEPLKNLHAEMYNNCNILFVHKPRQDEPFRASEVWSS